MEDNWIGRMKESLYSDRRVIPANEFSIHLAHAPFFGSAYSEVGPGIRTGRNNFVKSRVCGRRAHAQNAIRENGNPVLHIEESARVGGCGLPWITSSSSS